MGEYLLVECYGIDLKNYKMEKTIEWVRIHLKKFVCELEPEIRIYLKEIRQKYRYIIT